MCLHLDRVLSPLPLHARHSTGDTTHTTNGSTGTVTNLTRPSPRPARDDARPRRRAIYDDNYDIFLFPPSFNGTRMSHHAAREMRDPCVAVRFASGAHITRASRRLWATQSTCCSTSAWFRTTCQISVDPCRPMPTRQIPSCTCSVRAHPARGMHVECRGSGWVPHVTTPLSPDRGSPHSHIPHIHTPPSAPALGGHEGETPQPPSPHRLARQAPLAPTLPAPLKGARGNGSRPRRCSTEM